MTHPQPLFIHHTQQSLYETLATKVFYNSKIDNNATIKIYLQDFTLVL